MTTKDTTVTKATVAECINQEIGFLKDGSIAIIDDILDEIKTSLAKDRIVKISSFGTFLVKNKKKHVVRFWEGQFHQIKPIKRKGRGLYDHKCIEAIKKKNMLYDKGYTIKGNKSNLVTM